MKSRRCICLASLLVALALLQPSQAEYDACPVPDPAAATYEELVAAGQDQFRRHNLRLSRACYHLALHRFWLTFGTKARSKALQAGRPQTASMAGKIQQMTDELRYYGREASATGSSLIGKSDSDKEEGVPLAAAAAAAAGQEKNDSNNDDTGGGPVDQAAQASGGSVDAQVDAREEDLTERFRKYGYRMGESFKWKAPTGARVRGGIARNGARFVLRYPKSFDPDDPAREAALAEAGLQADARPEGQGLGVADEERAAIRGGSSVRQSPQAVVQSVAGPQLPGGGGDVVTSDGDVGGDGASETRLAAIAQKLGVDDAPTLLPVRAEPPRQSRAALMAASMHHLTESPFRAPTDALGDEEEEEPVGATPTSEGPANQVFAASRAQAEDSEASDAAEPPSQGQQERRRQQRRLGAGTGDSASSLLVLSPSEQDG